MCCGASSSSIRLLQVEPRGEPKNPRRFLAGKGSGCSGGTAALREQGGSSGAGNSNVGSKLEPAGAAGAQLSPGCSLFVPCQTLSSSSSQRREGEENTNSCSPEFSPSLPAPLPHRRRPCPPLQEPCLIHLPPFHRVNWPCLSRESSAWLSAPSCA